MRVVLTEKANADLLRIYRHVARDNPAAAQRITARIDVCFKEIGAFPSAGATRDEILPGLRSRIVFPYVVFYLAEANRILVVRIVDGRMDLGSELER